jgi:hypothetical protein
MMVLTGHCPSGTLGISIRSNYPLSAFFDWHVATSLLFAAFFLLPICPYPVFLVNWQNTRTFDGGFPLYQQSRQIIFE